MTGTWILRDDRGRYVNLPGSRSSYTNRPHEAQRYLTREAANADRCGNETAVDLRDLMGL